MASRPRKPWRLILTGTGDPVESDHTSERKTYDQIREVFSESGPASSAKIMQWEGGRWWHFETVTRAEIEAARSAGG
jgi:hypothetical protein